MINLMYISLMKKTLKQDLELIKNKMKFNFLLIRIIIILLLKKYEIIKNS